jgi:CubicO group peptidase (beta-lactamase class C family)
VTYSSKVYPEPITELTTELDRLAADIMTDGQVPGAAIAVVYDDKVAVVKAYGQRDVESESATSTQFLICSITKSFTATANGALAA